MIEQAVEITNSLGLHARPAAQFVRTASGFASEVVVVVDGAEINGKSIMGVMMLAAECGSSLVIRTRGADEVEALAAMVNLVHNGFGEA